MRAVLSAALLMLAQASSAMHALDVRGLSVAIERIAEPLVIDGLAMHVERAQGAEVGELASRIEGRWHRDRSKVLHNLHGGWQIRSRWDGSRSEVIQWRGEGDQAELLFSWFDASRKPGRVPAEPLVLPSQCAWTRRVEGGSVAGRYLQLTARCRIGVEGLASRIEPMLARHEWAVRNRGALAWEVARHRETARATVVPAASPDESALVWITTMPGRSP